MFKNRGYGCHHFQVTVTLIPITEFVRSKTQQVADPLKKTFVRSHFGRSKLCPIRYTDTVHDTACIILMSDTDTIVGISSTEKALLLL